MKNTTLLLGALSLLALGIQGCSGGSGSTASTGTTSTGASVAATPQVAAQNLTPTQAAAQSTGPGATDAKNCDVPYGDAPAQLSTLTSGDGSGALEDVAGLFNACLLEGGETLNWTDSANEARGACLFTPPNASFSSHLPLVVFLQGSMFPASPQLILNNWASLYSSTNLTNDPSRPGFILLVPIGRNTHHYYPFPDTYALGWDNWHRNLDRSSPDLNVDVATIDAFISQVKARNIVDTDRIYMTGWSNGGAMAELYSLNTPSIAATAVYSAPAPFSDIQDPCEQTPFATTLPPVMDLHNTCDIIGTCQTSSVYHSTLATLFPALKQNVVLLDALKQPATACDSICASQSIIANPLGVANHLIWPLNWNDQMFGWLRDHPLSARQ